MNGSSEPRCDLAEAIDVFLVVIEAEADAQHVAAKISDDARVVECGLPCGRAWTLKRKEARAGLKDACIEQASRAEAGFIKFCCERIEERIDVCVDP